MNGVSKGIGRAAAITLLVTAPISLLATTTAVATTTAAATNPAPKTPRTKNSGPTAGELRLVRVPSQREVYYSLPTPSERHREALDVFLRGVK